MISDSAALELEAWATVLAAGAAIVALFFARAAWKREQSVEKKLLASQKASRRAEKRAQAEKVAAWLNTDVEDHTLAGDPILSHSLAVRNASDAPVYDVKLVIYHRDEELTLPVFTDVIPPTNEPENLELVPEEAAKLNELLLGDPWGPGPLLVSIKFQDASGRRWHRDRFGNLARHEGERWSDGE
ncbi:hypothetical protein [Mumia sp. DW29H23]|uniref:hypothetical protein n=1 Tax=Mumia sp. DW29H23 TaxID=3421241 RepID=UPI003D6825DB